jgi:hypothetical protein
MPPPRERASPRRTPARWRARRPRRLAIALVLCALAALSPRASAAVDDASADDDPQVRGSIAIELSTRDAVAARRDTYTYAHASMPKDGAHYIARFEPKADMAIVHHMLLFGCERGVASTLRTRSGGMFSAPGPAATSVEPRGAMCADSNVEPFIFGWGKNAPDLVLPKDVGFRVGAEGGGFESLVLEVHYLEAQARSPRTGPRTTASAW